MLNNYLVTGNINGLMLARDNDQLLAWRVTIPVSHRITSHRPHAAIVLAFTEIAQYYDLITPHWAGRPAVEWVGDGEL